MKFGLTLLTLYFALFSVGAIAQSVVITPRKVTYTRKNATSPFKKTFTVVYPKIKASTPALSRKIEAAISFENNQMFTIKGEMGEYQWLEEAEYEVHYNKNGILNIWLRMTGTAAHPTYQSRSVVVDLKTGRKLRPADVFVNIAGLVEKVKKIQQDAIKAGIEEIKKDPEYQNENTAKLFEFTDFKAVNLEGFDIGDDGTAFNYDYGFPYIFRTIEPNGYYHLTWAEAKPFIRKSGLLGRFIR